MKSGTQYLVIDTDSHLMWTADETWTDNISHAKLYSDEATARRVASWKATSRNTAHVPVTLTYRPTVTANRIA